MLFVAMSDTHSRHREIRDYNDIPDGDVLLHCGDWSGYGTLDEAKDFNDWLGKLPHKYKIVIAGNHDLSAWERHRKETQKIFTNAIYLQDESITLDGIKIHGHPWTPMLCNWYFMLERGSSKMRRKVNDIPEDVDILMSHGPPLNKLDWSVIGGQRMGCEDLRNRVDTIRPKIHVFGHNHADYGGAIGEHTTFINVATCNEHYIPVNKPICFGLSSV